MWLVPHFPPEPVLFPCVISLCSGSPDKKAFVPFGTALLTVPALLHWGGHRAGLAESHPQPGGAGCSPRGFRADGVDLREQELSQRERDVWKSLYLASVSI